MDHHSIIGHLHIDHAGGLDLFRDNKNVEIWVHDKELRAAFWSVATKADAGVYLPHYLHLDLNWKTFDDRTIDFCQGISLHHTPGHTDGKWCRRPLSCESSTNSLRPGRNADQSQK